MLSTASCFRFAKSAASRSAPAQPSTISSKSASARRSYAKKASAQKGTSAKPTLHHVLNFCSTRPLAVINELGIADKINVKHHEKEDLKTKAYLAINPHGTTPVLELPNGVNLLESGAISLHLLETHGGPQHPLFGKPEHRAELLQWLFYSPATLYHAMGPGFSGTPKQKKEARAALESIHLPFIASKLGKQKYILGNEFTIADIFLGYELGGIFYLGWLEKFPTLQAYVGTVCQRPSVLAAFSANNILPPKTEAPQEKTSKPKKAAKEEAEPKEEAKKKAGRPKKAAL